MSDEEIIGCVEPARWKPLELFRTIYPDDPDIDNLDVLYPGRIGYIIKNDDGSIKQIVIARVWPHSDKGDEEETGLYGPTDE
jgi:hypothetical protein